ncbi:hypothetical protein B0J18DRAFT_430451 [Chaetomium sp. MPI-SDFR-AT-0129]|nr:hypothetical protein B0J18DRAFT_430451 [Chaetomium sp. MPI-SDFR-AT-0129]
MQGAVYRGLFNLDSPPLFNCSSSCRWNGTYVSLGFTSTCADVTEATLRLHPDASGTWDKTGMTNMSDMYLTTPGGVRLDATYSYTSYQTVISIGAISLLKADAGAVPPGGTTGMGSGIARITVLRVPVDSNNWGFLASDMNITECDVSLAAHRFHGLSSSGANLTASRREVLTLPKGVVTAQGGRADYLTFNPPGLPSLRIAVPDLSALGLLFTSSRFAGNIFDGEASTNVADDSQGMGDAFLRTPNPAVAIHAMTDSMTDQLRAVHEQVAAGESEQQIVFVQVEWGWLALPVVVQVIAVVFLVLVLIQSGRASNLPLWKSSIVALLTYDVRFSDMDGQEHAADYVQSEKVRIGNLGTGVRSTRELDALAETVKAKLDLPMRRNTGGRDGAV